MKKLHKNDMAVENTVVAYACSCGCVWSYIRCACATQGGSTKVYDEENANETAKYDTMVRARDR